MGSRVENPHETVDDSLRSKHSGTVKLPREETGPYADVTIPETPYLPGEPVRTTCVLRQVGEAGIIGSGLPIPVHLGVLGVTLHIAGHLEEASWRRLSTKHREGGLKLEHGCRRICLDGTRRCMTCY